MIKTSQEIAQGILEKLAGCHGVSKKTESKAYAIANAKADKKSKVKEIAEAVMRKSAANGYNTGDQSMQGASPFPGYPTAAEMTSTPRASSQYHDVGFQSVQIPGGTFNPADAPQFDLARSAVGTPTQTAVLDFSTKAPAATQPRRAPAAPQAVPAMAAAAPMPRTQVAPAGNPVMARR